MKQKLKELEDKINDRIMEQVDFSKEGSAKQANDVAVKTIQSEKRFLRRVLGDVDMAVDIETTIKATKPEPQKPSATQMAGYYRGPGIEREKPQEPSATQMAGYYSGSDLPTEDDGSDEQTPSATQMAGYYSGSDLPIEDGSDEGWDFFKDGPGVEKGNKISLSDYLKKLNDLENQLKSAQDAAISIGMSWYGADLNKVFDLQKQIEDLKNNSVIIELDRTEYIDDQNQQSKDLKYGSKGDLSGNGCGSFMFHNIKIALGDPSNYNDVYKLFNDDGKMFLGPSAGGKLGTNPQAVKRELEKEGYDVTLDILLSENITDTVIKSTYSLIQTPYAAPEVSPYKNEAEQIIGKALAEHDVVGVMYLNKDATGKLYGHYIEAQLDDTGSINVNNAETNSSQPSLEDLIKSLGGSGMIVYGVDK